jgi:phage-related protein
MNLVKLNGRHKLFKSGYKIAFRFDNYHHDRDQIRAIEKWLESVYGPSYDYRNRMDNFYYAVYWAQARTRSSSKIYWIALKHEEDALLLTIAVQ